MDVSQSMRGGGDVRLMDRSIALLNVFDFELELRRKVEEVVRLHEETWIDDDEFR